MTLLSSDHSDNTFHALAHNVKIEKAGPPNQYFWNNACPAVAGGAAINVNLAEDAKEDCEPVEDGAPNKEGNGEFRSWEEGTADNSGNDVDGPPLMEIGAGLDSWMETHLSLGEQWRRGTPGSLKQPGM